MQTSPKSSVHAFDFRDVTERNARKIRHLINMQKRAIGVLRGLGTRLVGMEESGGLGESRAMSNKTSIPRGHQVL
jgi:hypothetical protein